MTANEKQMAASTDLFIPVKFNTSIQLKPNELGPNIEQIIYTKLKNNLENMCSKHGYIRKDSIKIIKRSAGQIKVSHFNGNVAYNIYCVAEICNPAQGSVIKCRVKAKNSLGLLANGYYDNVPILEIIVPKLSAGIQSEINIDMVNIGDEISIEVMGKKFQLYDKYISIIGKAIKERDAQIINNVIISEEGDDAVEEVVDDGINGINGINGIDFADGLEGADGVEGAEGLEGTEGADGVDETDGITDMPDEDEDDDDIDDMDDEDIDDEFNGGDDFGSIGGGDIDELAQEGGDFDNDF